MSYEAIICKLTNVREHPNADRLKLATVAGYQIVVGLNSQEDELGIFFPCDGKLSTEFCEANDLYPVFDENGKRIGGGFFDRKNSRVKSQRFRGEKSEGFFIGIHALAYTGANLDSLHEGFTFHTINGQQICEKYYSPATLRAMKGGTARTRKTNVMFPKHVDTLRWQYEADRALKLGSLCHITEKLHGTSGRVSFSVEETEAKRKWYHKLFGITPPPVREWQFLVGTRNVVLTDPETTQGFYEDESFRFRAVEPLRHNLHKGEVIYGEIVGWASETSPIMARQETKELKDIRSIYGDEMLYSYGTEQGECEFYVYRIAKVDEDGNLVELPWTQVKARCRELGLKVVPEISALPVYLDADSDKDLVKNLVDKLTEGVSTLDSRHIREGVVVRIENDLGETEFLKSKSFVFGVLEGYLKNHDDYVDTEEIS